MLDINLNNYKDLTHNLLKRGYVLNENLFVELYSNHKQLKSAIQDLKTVKNSINKGFNKLSLEEKAEISSKVEQINKEIKTLEQKELTSNNKLKDFLYTIPNIVQDSVPIGKSEEDNVELYIYKEEECKSSTKDHVDIGKELDGIDFEKGAAISGPRFPILKGAIARLHRALISYMLEDRWGYNEYYLPYLVKSSALYGTGQLPGFEDDLFKLKDRDLYLIPTAEVPLTNLYANTIIAEKELPIKLTAHTPCFRSEAGSYGKDTRGLIRVHQFDKVELVVITKAANSNVALETMCLHAQNILKELELPYRIVELCSGDLGFASSKTYDLEVWMPSHNKFREISSCSNTLDFQARRSKIRFKDNKSLKNEYVHTLNGSALAVGRTLAAVLENHYIGSGSLYIPNVLQKYLSEKDVLFFSKFK